VGGPFFRPHIDDDAEKIAATRFAIDRAGLGILPISNLASTTGHSEVQTYNIATKNSMSPGGYALENIECRLEAKQLWDKFHELGTEMIITKSGR